jgi:plasmid stabilization system protein ParE
MSRRSLTLLPADSIDAAVKVVLALEDAFVLLASRPGVGHARQDLTDRPLKFWSVYACLVVYAPPPVSR